MSLIATVGIFLLALVCLVKSADYFVHFAARIARRFGISEFIIGLTLVAVGTSLPELANALISSLRGDNAVALGNIIGANVANICVSIGLSTFLARVRIEPKLYRRELLVLGVATAVFCIALIDGLVTRSEGAIMLVLFAIYLQLVAKVLFDFSRLVDPAEISYFVEHLANLRTKILSFRLKSTLQKQKKVNTELAKDALALVVSAGVLVVSSDVLVSRALAIAVTFGTSVAGVGATIVAMGTTLPELSVSLSSVRKGYYHLLFGNIIGSNIVNLLLIGGLAAGLSPLVAPSSLIPSILFLLGTTAIGIILLTRKSILSRWVGAGLLAVYVGFLAISWLG